MKPIYTILMLIALMATMWSAAALKITAPPPPQVRAVELLSADIIEAVDEEMSLMQVEEVVGCTPNSVCHYYSPRKPGESHTVAMWFGRNGRTFRAEFAQDKLTGYIYWPD